MLWALEDELSLDYKCSFPIHFKPHPPTWPIPKIEPVTSWASLEILNDIRQERWLVGYDIQARHFFWASSGPCNKYKVFYLMTTWRKKLSKLNIPQILLSFREGFIGLLFPKCSGRADRIAWSITLIYCVEVTAVHALLICLCRTDFPLTQIFVIKIAYVDVPTGCEL